MIRRPPTSTRPDTLFPYTTLFRSALLDQRVVAGLGNIYVCEALFRARISPKRLAGTVKPERIARLVPVIKKVLLEAVERSEEHTSELQSLMRISYAVFRLKKKKAKHRYV